MWRLDGSLLRRLGGVEVPRVFFQLCVHTRAGRQIDGCRIVRTRN